MAAQSAATKRSTPPEPRTHAVRREEAERAMLKAAVSLIAAKGIAGLTLNEVGEAAGYSRGLPAHYFGTRDALLGAVALHIVKGFAHGLRREEIAPGLDGVLRAVDAYLAAVAKDPMKARAFVVVMAEASSHPGIHPEISELTRHSIDGIAAGLKAGQRKGEVRRDIDPRVQGALILGQLRGIAAQWLIDPKLFGMNAARAELVASLKRSLTP
jgi:AcrR family transcriptional regulator